ncbi:DUF169 domain-containing protein [Chloroflexota bacterium]
MMTLSDFNSCGEELERRLRLKTFPFAVKLLEKEEDIPEGAIRPKRDLGHHLDLCQGFAMSRREGKLMAMLKDDMWCYTPVIALGLAEPPAHFLEGHMYYPSRVSTLEAAKNVAAMFPRLEYGKYVGIVSAPLKAVNFEPDLVTIYCNSAQLTSLLLGIRYKEGYQVTTTITGAAACVYPTVPVIKSKECQVAVPCRGDRKWALAQDDEMVFSLPKEKLEDLMLGLRHLDEAGPLFPLDFGMRPERALSKGYVKMGRMLGMEVHE